MIPRLFILIIIFFIIMNYIDFKIISGILLFIYLFNEYKSIKEDLDNQLIEKLEYNPLPHYGNHITSYLKRLESYKKKNLLSYKEGMKYWNLFIQNVKKLENKKLIDYSNIYDNAVFYLHKSINIFQSFTTNTNSSLSDMKNISSIVKNLYKESYLILYHLSYELNKRWKKHPDINNKEIIINDISYPLDFSKSFDFYG